MQLIRKHGKDNIFYWKDEKQHEVDFVIKDKLTVKELYQVSFDISNPKTVQREIRALLKAMDDFQLNEATILTQEENYQEKHKDKTINFVPLWRWLLQENPRE